MDCVYMNSGSMWFVFIFMTMIENGNNMDYPLGFFFTVCY